MSLKIFFFPILLTLIGAGVYFTQLQKTDLKNLVPVTLSQYEKCLNNNIPTDSCTQSQVYQEYLQAFVETTMSETASDDCNKVKDIIRQGNPDAYINENNYFFKCYINDHIRKFANTNQCFFKTFYAPNYLICGGFDIYAFPPYTSYDINN
ncbi:transmembrane protein, putative (macronuclear) [Tetrahymena thermophila SB210]|uniref:Transmembrane protein, putative n=1 Tax=Tetrahymena thermophila (strain SB210) TaxID=312017 RepID=Q23B23_TETTS|nr:transmembrane protein, putative [Tetrahymena thermophila SB210]EAR93661.1 transmembrane protein, putative [Tetrahymena thermophila SB210]|eukprot:XP_001013906.1 transmembrane protein, putative [Tetrahymena thermophila SB210]